MPTSTTIKSIMDGKRRDCSFGTPIAVIVATIASYCIISIKQWMAITRHGLLATINTTHLVMARKVASSSIAVAAVEGTAVGACFVAAWIATVMGDATRWVPIVLASAWTGCGHIVGPVMISLLVVDPLVEELVRYCRRSMLLWPLGRLLDLRVV
jgi:hypothetical protein